ncbi:MAG: ATP-binding protein [Spirochaetaceae bacterium]|jgi:predicted AAA+ superfamily ATPase|nr:ATP-binding protein [Spirochaetaceae bacterium]
MNNAVRTSPKYICRTVFSPRITDALDDSRIILLTGIRRCGKSFLVRELIASLKESGVEDDHIIYLDFEKIVFPEVQTQRELKQHLSKLITADKKYYLFLDEVQTISGWEKTLAPLVAQGSIALCVAVSGASYDKSGKKKLFASDWAEVKLSPLSYAEYRRVVKPVLDKQPLGLLQRAIAVQESAHTSFASYVEKGGFPATIFDEGLSYKTKLNDIYTSILHHDVIRRYNIKNTELLEKIIKYIFEHIGEECSAGKLTEHFKREKYTKNLSDISSIIRYLESAFVIVRLRMMNFVTMKIQAAHSRYYIGDHALFHAISCTINPARRGILENIIVNELQRHGCEIFSGKINAHSIDFVATSSDKIFCIQTIMSDDTLEMREAKEAALSTLHEFVEIRAPLFLFVVYLDSVIEYEDRGGPLRHISLPDFLISCAEHDR